MRTIESQVTIQRPKDEVWAILSDLTAMGRYMPGIQDVQFTTETTQGIGAARHCSFADGIELHEQVVHWEEGEGYTLETTQFVKVPMKANLITFSLRTDENNRKDSTVVSQSMRYQMQGGPFAPIMELMAKGMMLKALNGALAGLKEYAEVES